MSSFLHALGQRAEMLQLSVAPLDADGARHAHSFLEKDIWEIEQIIHRSEQVIQRGIAFSVADLPAYFDAVKAEALGKGIDDRKFLLEKVLVLMSRLPDDSRFSARLQQFVIDLLYKDLAHPPSGYLSVPKPLPPPPSTDKPSKSIGYAFRDSDGVNYNPLFPSMGKFRSPYARSVSSTNITPLSSLPDPGLVFDTLLKRSEEFEPHPGGISSLFFAFADLVIHSIFHTDHDDWTVNATSSYLDLSPLYGSSKDQVDSRLGVRRKDGTGRLWNDVFADARIRFMPPSVCALLVLFNRNHNYIAKKILNINERSTFISPPPSDVAAKLAQDDEIFHRARLVNCGFFMKVILGDYVGAILGLARDGLAWRLDPLMTMRRSDHEFSPRGEGNVVSIEFNLLYRWHATISKQDAEWTADLFKTIFDGKDFGKLRVCDFETAAHKYMIPDPDVKTWNFDNLERDTTGRFRDDDLARILQNATEWSAGAFKARGVPEVMRVIEILGIEQSRSWGTCSMNEFRKFMGLKPYASFKEWNTKPEIYNAAQALYESIDNLELYVGLHAEEAKRPMPGAGLCPGFTISRAILADAVALTRGDRFLTVDFTPFNVTSWGYQDCQYDTADGSYGGMLTKLLFRTLPDHYPAGSAYAHFPFLVPEKIKKWLGELKESPVDKYTWNRPLVPQALAVVKPYHAVSQILNLTDKFVSEYNHRLFLLTQGIVLDRALVSKVLFADVALQKWRGSFLRIASSLIKEKSVNHVGSTAKYVDIVKDVINLVPVHWIANEIAGLPMKYELNALGVYSEQHLFDMFADVCNYVFLNFGPDHDWSLRESSVGTATKVIQYVQAHLTKLSKGVLSFDGFSDSVLRYVAGNNDHSDDFLTQLVTAGSRHTARELAGSLFAEVIPTTAHFSQAITHIVNFYLEDDKKEALQDIVRLTGLHAPDAEQKILAYAWEALRLDPPVSIVFRTATADIQLGPTSIRAGQRVLASVVDANLDAAIFGPEPKTATFNRSSEHAGIFGVGEYGLLCQKFFEKTAPQVLRVIFSLRHIKRGPGNSGKLKRFTEQVHGTRQTLYLTSRGEVTPWPRSLVLEYNGKA